MIRIDPATCDTCGACVAVCPHDSLHITESLTVNLETCTTCGRCVKLCPFGAISVVAVSQSGESGL